LHWQSLPPPHAGLTPAFTDAASAQAWLEALAPETVTEALIAIGEQIEAIDAATLPAPQAIALLSQLRSAAVPLQASAEALYTRKPLPLSEPEELAFSVARDLWMHLGVAYLRLVSLCTPANRCLPLERAANAFRLAQHTCFLAARSYPREIDGLFIEVLASAEANGVLRRPLADPDFPHDGKSSVSGELAWALMFRAIDPYHLTAIHLPFANRIFRRWRELTGFQATPEDVKSSQLFDLQELAGTELPAGIPRYLNIRTVAHKLAGRITALQGGQSPESLHLGRTLSPAAATRLLRDIERRLHPRHSAGERDEGQIELVFGGEDAYALLKDSVLNPVSTPGGSTTSPYGRSGLAQALGETPAAKLAGKAAPKVQGERWKIIDGTLVRVPAPEQKRLSSPCLVAAILGKKARLGILGSLQCADDGSLTGQPRWIDDTLETGCLKRLSPRGQKLVRVPAFVIQHGEAPSLILPPEAGARLGVRQELTGMSLEALTPVEVIERGTDFVRYACTAG
jgi:hypothetical protein